MSITNNLAEGSGRRSPSNRRLFYDNAKGSLYEVVSILVLARRRGFITGDDYQTLYRSADEVAAIISGLMAAASREKGNIFREEEAAYDHKSTDSTL